MALPDATATPDPFLRLSRRLDAIGLRTSTVRGLSALKPLDREFLDRGQLSVRLREDLEEERDDILQEQSLYRLLGVLPPDGDLYELLLAVYSETVLGFFDPEEERLYVVGNDDDMTAQDVLTFSHEYTHGLQQQHYDIHSIGETLEENSDASLAFSALVEGDATISEALYMLQYMDEEEQLAAQDVGAGVSFDAFRAAPRSAVLHLPVHRGASLRRVTVPRRQRMGGG